MSGFAKLPLFATVLGGATFRLGRGIAGIALAWHVANAQGAAALGQMAAVYFTAMIVGSIGGGALVDRYGVRAVGLGAVAIAVLGFAGQAMALTPEFGPPMPFATLLALIALASLGDGAASGAFLARLPELSERAGVQLDRANASSELLDSVGGIIVAVVVGALIAAGGVALPMWIGIGVSMVGFALAAIGLPAPAPGVRESIRPLEGVRYVLRHAALLPIVGVSAVLLASFQVLQDVTFPIIVTQAGWDADRLGTVLGTAGIGAVCGSLLFAAVSTIVTRRTAFVAMCVLVAAAFAAIGFVTDWWLFLSAVFAAALAGGVLAPLVSTIVQEAADSTVRGRVLGGVGALVLAAVPVATLASGYAVEPIGTFGVMVCLSGIILSMLALASTNARFLAPADPTTPVERA